MGKILVTGNALNRHTAPVNDIQVLDPRFGAVAECAGALERLCGGAAWSEGPVWLPEQIVVDRCQGRRLNSPNCVAAKSDGSGEDGVQVSHPDGTRIGRIAVPEKVGKDGGPKNLFDPDNGYRNQYRAIWGTK
jgi:hypothetical protein